MEQEKIDIYAKLYNTPFAEQVAFNLEQLEYRYNKLVEIVVLISSVIIMLCVIIVTRVRKRNKSINDYYA